MDSGARSGQQLRRIPAGLAALIALALFSASGLNAPGAGADPTDLAQPPSPATAEAAPASEVTLPAAMAATADAVAHLPSPDNLPPGTTQEPPERRTLGYLRDIWNTVRTEDVTMSDMLLLIAQRPMSTGSAPVARKPATETSAPDFESPAPDAGPPAPAAGSAEADAP